jgi:UTP:GlnB (protein PII) uridylyltransferase
VNGTDFKEELKRLDEFYSALPEAERKTGLINFAKYPPDDTSFLTTRLWDRYLPRWREIKAQPKAPRDPEEDKKLIEKLTQMSDSPELVPHNERDSDKLQYFTIIKNVRMRKGKWQRFSQEQEQRMREIEEDS